MNSHPHHQNENTFYLRIVILLETLAWINIYEMIIFLNESFNNWSNKEFKNDIDTLLAGVFLFSRSQSMLFAEKIYANKREGLPFKLFHVFVFVTFAVVSHTTFACLFCKYQSFDALINVSYDDLLMFLHFYSTTLICLFIRTIKLLFVERNDKLPINKTNGSCLIFLFFSIVLLSIQTFLLQTDIYRFDVFIPNLFMLLYYTFLLENIYFTINFRAVVFKVLYFISIMIMFVPTIANSLKLTNSFV